MNRTVLGIAMVLASQLALGTHAERPLVTVGYRLTYQGRMMGVDCTDWRIAEIQKDGHILARCRNYILESSGTDGGNPIRISTLFGVKLVEFLPFSPMLNLPLVVGKTWQGTYTAFTTDKTNVVETHSECQVSSFDKIAVIAGDLDAFKIECTDTSQSGGKPDIIHTTRWYSPTAAAIVKSLQQENPAKWNFELTSFGLPEGAPVPAGKARASPISHGNSGVPSPPQSPNADAALQKIAPIRDPLDY